MILIPAIDLKDGQCVRLRQGNMDDSTVFCDDPVAMAGQWVEQGCSRLHIVDLDGAFEGDILAAMQGAVFKGGGDYAGNEFIIGSGPGALPCRYYSGRRPPTPAACRPAAAR